MSPRRGPRGHFAPRLSLLSSSFSEINSSAKVRVALKRHTVLYRLTEIKLNMKDSIRRNKVVEADFKFDNRFFSGETVLCLLLSSAMWFQ